MFTSTVGTVTSVLVEPTSTSAASTSNLGACTSPRVSTSTSGRLPSCVFSTRQPVSVSAAEAAIIASRVVNFMGLSPFSGDYLLTLLNDDSITSQTCASNSGAIEESCGYLIL